MSYRILYNAIFLRSQKGITPVVLSGDNNVYDTDGHGRSIRRSRDWGCLNNFLAESADTLMAFAEKFSPDDEIWRYHRRLVNGPALVRWMTTGIKNAVSVEDLLKNNRQNHITCYISVWGRDRYAGRFCCEELNTTEALDAWIDEAKRFVASCDDDMAPFYIIKFETEDIRPLTVSGTTKKVIIKSSYGYLSEITPDSLQWDADIHHALEMDALDAERLIGTRIHTHGVRIFSASCKNQSYNSIVALMDANGKTTFVKRFTNNVVYTTPNINMARRYSTNRYAHTAITRMDKVLRNNGLTARVVVL